MSDTWQDQLALGLEKAGDPKLIRASYVFVGDVTESKTWKLPIVSSITGKSILGLPTKNQLQVALTALTELKDVVLPKKLAARKLMQSFQSIGVDPPAELVELGTFASVEEAFAETHMLSMLGDSSGIESLKFLVIGLAMSGESPVMPTLDDLKKSIESIGKGVVDAGVLREPSGFDQAPTIPEQTTVATTATDGDDESGDEDPDDNAPPPDSLENPYVAGEKVEEYSPRAMKALSVARRKGLPDTLSANGQYVGIMRNLKYANRGRTIEDYYATKEELQMWNLLSGVDLTKGEELIVITSESAESVDNNPDPDSQGDVFLQEGINDMAMGCPDTPLLKDHNWTMDNVCGKCIGGSSEGGVFRQKFGILNTPENKSLITNVLNRVYGKVSVGFTAPLEKLVCMSCKGLTSIYDEACPHTPGEFDEFGKQVIVGIKGVGRYCETSLVAVPAVASASIGLRSFKVTGSFEKSAKNVNTIPSVKSNATEGVQVANATTPDSTENATVEEVAKADSLGAPDQTGPWAYQEDPLKKLPGDASQEQVPSDQADPVDDPTSVSVAIDPSDLPQTTKSEVAEGEDKSKTFGEVESLKSVVTELSALIADMKALFETQKSLFSSFTPAADLIKRQDETEASLKQLTEVVEAATHITLENIERQKTFVKAESASRDNTASVKTIGSMLLGGLK